MMKKRIEYKYIVAAFYSVILFLDRLDLTIINIALPAIAETFDVPITATEWINNAFLLALAIALPVSTWLGERFGDKRLFIFSILLFSVSSIACAFSPYLLFMIMVRFIQGFAGGLIIPVGMSMVYRAFDASEYVSISSFIFIPSLIAPALAPALGGVIIHVWSWKWIFLFSPPICLLVAALSFVFLREKKCETVAAFDVLGFIFLAVALIVTLYLLSYLGKYGFNMQAVSLLAIACLSTFLLIQHEKKQTSPLVELKLFENALFLKAHVIQLSFQVCHFGSIFLVSAYLQLSVEMSALTTGMTMGMQAIGAMCTSRLSVLLFNQYGPKVPIVSAFIGIAVVTPFILLINPSSAFILGASILLLRGFCSGLCGAPMQTISILEFKNEEISRASALFNIGRQLSISLGIALSALLIAYGYRRYHIDITDVALVVPKAVFYPAFSLLVIMPMLGIVTALKINRV
ncbi:MAG: DHA2 family efflux MFS transporter permease subunit [Gammaproteobacteria bacterium]|nr:DHA2 family efflux MFS transporter permease subunit [Gammaproteobacteria bacterium]